MPRGDFCPLGQVVWGLVGAKVRLPRPTNCANAPGGCFPTRKRERVANRAALFSAGRLSESAGEQMSEAEILLPNLAGGLGLGLGRKYAYLVLPTVLMPHVRFDALEQYSIPKRGIQARFLTIRVKTAKLRYR